MEAKETEKENIDNMDNVELQDIISDFFIETDSYRLRMIDWKRDFIKQIVLLSAWVIAFSIPILNNWGFVNIKRLFIVSQIIFVLLIITWVFYFYRINNQEEKIYTNIISPFKSVNEKTSKEEFILNTIIQLKKMAENLPNPKKVIIIEKFSIHFLTWWFIVWLIILVISLFA